MSLEKGSTDSFAYPHNSQMMLDQLVARREAREARQEGRRELGPPGHKPQPLEYQLHSSADGQHFPCMLWCTVMVNNNTTVCF